MWFLGVPSSRACGLLPGSVSLSLTLAFRLSHYVTRALLASTNPPNTRTRARTHTPPPVADTNQLNCRLVCCAIMCAEGTGGD
jgi:hypothetical protein